MKKIINKIMTDSLYRNSIFLMLSTGVMSLFGFFFWMICSRLFTAEQVGLATTIISVMSLITTFSALGLGVGLIRCLPQSERKNDKINTCLTLVAIVSIIISSIFILGISEFSPRLSFIKDNVIISLVFMISMVISSFSSLIESLFIAYRSTKYTLLKNAIFSVLKMILPFVLISFGIWGIFGSWVIGVLAGVIVSFFILVRKFKYQPKFVFHDSIIRKIGRYSFGNYLAGFIGSMPALLLPLMITNSIHPEITAYYYMAMMIANVLFIIPQATSNSLFAEGSYDENNLKKQVKKSAKIISLLLIPAIIITLFLGKYILLLLGTSYSSEGYQFLNLLAVSGVFIGINNIFSSIFKVQKRVKEMIFRSLIGTIILLGLSYWFINNGFGLMGIGYSWIIGQGIISLLYIMMWLIKKKK